MKGGGGGGGAGERSKAVEVRGLEIQGGAACMGGRSEGLEKQGSTGEWRRGIGGGGLEHWGGAVVVSRPGETGWCNAGSWRPG